MQYKGNFSGSSPVVIRYKVSATGLVAGVIVCAAIDGSSGEMIVTAATATANQMGLLADSASAVGETLTYSTTQGDAEASYGVIVNPDAILRGLMVTGATGTSITQDTVVTAASNGLTVVGGTSVASPDMDQGTIWYTSGANVGRSRKITSTSSVTATVIVPFAANAVGDTFLYAGISPGLQGITLTTSVLNLRADIAIATGVNVTTVKMECNGSTDSFAHVVMTDHVFAQIT